MTKMPYVKAIIEALREEMERDERVFVMGEDVAILGSAYRSCTGLCDEFGRSRVFNTPISEVGICGLGMGAAITGMRPVCDIMFADFLGCAMDQITNQIAKAKYMFGGDITIPMVIKTQEGGYVQNAAQHSACVEAWFMHTPGLKLVMPSNAADAKGLMKTAVRDDNPVIFIDHKLLYDIKGEVPDEDYTIPFGVADVKREGSDVTVVAISYEVVKSLKAAKKLEKEGISVEVIDPRTLVPLDVNTILKSVKKTGRLVIVHEANIVGGVGAEIAATVAKEGFKHLKAPIERVAAKQCPVPYSKTLENAMLPQEEDIVAAVKSVLNYK